MGNSANRKVVVTDYLNDDFAVERKILDGVAVIEAAQAQCEEELIGKVEAADALVVYHEIVLTGKTLRRLEKCKLISRGGVGVDNIDHRLARELGSTSRTFPITARRTSPTRPSE
jgi:D-3-phosphoglycerate dehydrogenase/C-terminal binding protein